MKFVVGIRIRVGLDLGLWQNKPVQDMFQGHNWLQKPVKHIYLTLFSSMYFLSYNKEQDFLFVFVFFVNSCLVHATLKPSAWVLIFFAAKDPITYKINSTTPLTTD